MTGRHYALATFDNPNALGWPREPQHLLSFEAGAPHVAKLALLYPGDGWRLISTDEVPLCTVQSSYNCTHCEELVGHEGQHSWEADADHNTRSTGQ